MHLSENTAVPLKWMFILLSISGSAFIMAVTLGWKMALFNARADGLEIRLENTIKTQSALIDRKHVTDDYLRSIDQRLSRIEGKMGIGE